MRAARWRAYVAAYGLVAPAFALVVGQLVYPLVYALQLSLTDAKDFSDQGQFVGLRNYAHIAMDQDFWAAARNTTFLVLATTGAEFLVGLLAALLLWRRAWLRPLLMASVFVPWVYPSAFANFTWYWILQPPFITFYTPQALQARLWWEGIFGDQAWQVFSFAFTSLWRGSSIIAIVLLAGLRAIPQDLLEYARLETAGLWRLVWSVALPLARRFVVLAIVVAMTITYLDFQSMYQASNGRIIVPVLGTLVYMEGLGAGRMSYAAALSLTQVPIVFVLVLFVVPLIGRQVRRGVVPEQLAGPWRLGGPSTDGRPSSSAASAVAGRRRLLVFPFGSLGCLALTIFYLFPIYYTAVQSVKSRYDFREEPRGQPFWVYSFDFADGLGDTLQDPLFWQSGLTTLIVFGCAIVIGSAVALLAAYVLARFKLPGAEWLVRGLFASYFLPQLAVVVPLFRLYHTVGLDNTAVGLVLLYLTLAIPFATWLLYVYFQGLDPDIEEHAWLDGTRFRVFLHVVLPRTWPVLIAGAMFAMGLMASDVVYARYFATSTATQTLPVSMGSLVYDADHWEDANAGILLAVLPLTLSSLLLARFYLRGLRAAVSDDGTD